MDLGESTEKAAEFKRKYGLTYPVLADPHYETFQRLRGGVGVPYNVIVDEDNFVRASILGFSSAKIVRELEMRVAGAAPKKPSRATN